MRSLINPRWIIVINTIPAIILAMIYLSTFQVIHTLLEPETIELWKGFAIGFLALWAATLAYALYAIINNRNLSVWYGLVSLLAYVPFLYAFGYCSGELIPWSIPTWMIPSNMLLYVGSFMMPSLAHALMVLVIGLTPPRAGGYQSWKNFLLALSIPLAWYLFVEVVVPLWRPASSNYSEYIIIVAVFCTTTLFLLLLVRGMYILVQKRGGTWKQYQLLWKIPIGIIFPLMGLALNNGILFFDHLNFDGIFGDFSNQWFYILAIINGIVLCIPKPQHIFHRLLIFVLQSITFSYTLYFFLVFIPFLPLSIVGIVAFGLGFLLLTPLVLMVFHSMDLSSDFRFLKRHYSPKILLPLFCFGVASIPLALTYNYTLDRIALQDALAYIYQSDYDQNPKKKINTRGLNRVIKTLRSHKKNQRNADLSIGQTPFLSPFYNWLVLDNLTLSEKKIRDIEDIFFGQHEHLVTWNTRNEMPPANGTSITNISTQSTYDEEEAFWKTWVDLEITNATNQQKEFVTNFRLPEGAWISDYYLWIEGERVSGILAEKKTATWVYQQIVSRRRDPGILYYLDNGYIAFRVFPFAANETRKTGFQILHKEPISFKIDEQKIALGNPLPQDGLPAQAIYSKDQKVVYLPTALKNKLPQLNRSSYHHFIVDCSAQKDTLIEEYITTIENLMTDNPALNEHGKITFANTYCETITLMDDWKTKLRQQDYTGGYNLERAIKNILVQQGEKPAAQIPKIIAITNHLNEAIVPNNFASLSAAIPDLNYFYTCSSKETTLMTFSLNKNARLPLAPDQIATSESVLAWPDTIAPKAYVSAAATPSVILLEPIKISSLSSIKEKNWNDALMLEGLYQSYIRYPKNKDAEWHPMIRNSLSTYVLTPLMSFISLENEAQRSALKKKQKEVLKGNEALDLSEDAHKMSEPSLSLGLLFLLLWLIVRRRKTKRIEQVT